MQGHERQPGIIRVDKDIQRPLRQHAPALRLEHTLKPLSSALSPEQKGDNPRFHILFYRDKATDVDYWRTKESYCYW